jgi:tetratricopeptide (TPR) repeat protein
MRSVTCGACGAVIRANRPSCLRCGAPLEDAPEAAVETSTTAIPWTAIAAAIVLVLTGVTSFYMRGREVSRVASPGGASATQRGDATSTRSGAPDGIGAAASALDANRAGAAAYGRGEIAGALARFEAAVASNPMDPAALNNLGQALVRDGRVRDAIGYFDKAVSLTPGQWSYHFNRARAHGLLEEWPAAIDGYREAQRLFPDDYVTEYNLARALRADGQLDEAIAGFERAIALAPGQADFHLSYGLALEAAGRGRDAAAAYRQYLDLEPDGADAAKITARAGQLEQSTPAAAR